MALLILELVKAGLSLLDTHLQQKYKDKSLQLDRDYFAARNAIGEDRDNALIDNLEFEIASLGKAFLLDVRGIK